MGTWVGAFRSLPSDSLEPGRHRAAHTVPPIIDLGGTDYSGDAVKVKAIERQLIRIDGIQLEPGERTRLVDFVWQWSRGLFGGQQFKSTARFRLYDDGWRLDDRSLVEALRPPWGTLEMKGPLSALGRVIDLRLADSTDKEIGPNTCKVPYVALHEGGGVFLHLLGLNDSSREVLAFSGTLEIRDKADRPLCRKEIAWECRVAPGVRFEGFDTLGPNDGCRDQPYDRIEAGLSPLPTAVWSPHAIIFKDGTSIENEN